MGNKTSSPIAGKTLKDTTLRSVVFDQKDIEVIQGQGQVVLKTQVSSEKFEEYINVLKKMAQLSRLVYCDSGIIREVLVNDKFKETDNPGVNNLITELNKKYLSERKQPSTFENSKEGRPMNSYVLNNAAKGESIAEYVSTPSDLTFLIISGKNMKHAFFKDDDTIIIFKGSSTMQNFKHDLYSQFTPADMTTVKGKPGIVVGSFLNVLKDSLELIKSKIGTPNRLFIIGHSLGGAYASILALILLETGYTSKIHLITFGSPTILSDTARNTFNSYLDSGAITLDRVTSYFIKYFDPIPAIPAGFSHPGFQPLHTELYAESKTGRAYHIDTIRKVYQTGGLGTEKNKYQLDTVTHMPNKISIPVKTLKAKTFPHSEYFDMTWFDSMRWVGMKNPGFKTYTFDAKLLTDGITFEYLDSSSSIQAPEPTGKSDALTGGRKTYRRSKLFSKKTRRGLFR